MRKQTALFPTESSPPCRQQGEIDRAGFPRGATPPWDPFHNPKFRNGGTVTTGRISIPWWTCHGNYRFRGQRRSQLPRTRTWDPMQVHSPAKGVHQDVRCPLLIRGGRRGLGYRARSTGICSSARDGARPWPCRGLVSKAGGIYTPTRGRSHDRTI